MMESKNETAFLTFLKWIPLYEVEKPFQIFAELKLPEESADSREDNLVFDTSEETQIEDIRGREYGFQIDDNGFQFVQNKSCVEQFDSKDTIETVYLPELTNLLKRSLDDVDRVEWFNWKLRKNDRSKKGEDTINVNDPMQTVPPVHGVHIDTTAYSVALRIRREFPDEAEELLRRRIRVIKYAEPCAMAGPIADDGSVWRPINQPIEDCPLTVCDASSLRDDDIITCDHVTPQVQAETSFVLRNSSQRWCYLSRQTRDEVLLFKNFDSSPSVRAKCCPHTAFEHRSIPAGAPCRESIEARALVFGAGKAE